MQQEDRVRLTGWNLIHLESHSNLDLTTNILRLYTKVNSVSIDEFWGLLRRGGRYAHIANFSSRKFPEEEQLEYTFSALSPQFNAELLRRYTEKSYLTYSDIVDTNGMYNELWPNE